MRRKDYTLNYTYQNIGNEKGNRNINKSEFDR